MFHNGQDGLNYQHINIPPSLQRKLHALELVSHRQRVQGREDLQIIDKVKKLYLHLTAWVNAPGLREVVEVCFFWSSWELSFTASPSPPSKSAHCCSFLTFKCFLSCGHFVPLAVLAELHGELLGVSESHDEHLLNHRLPPSHSSVVMNEMYFAKLDLLVITFSPLLLQYKLSNLLYPPGYSIMSPLFLKIKIARIQL